MLLDLKSDIKLVSTRWENWLLCCMWREEMDALLKNNIKYNNKYILKSALVKERQLFKDIVQIIVCFNEDEKNLTDFYSILFYK